MSDGDFPRLALRASDIIDRLTFGKAAKAAGAHKLYAVKMATAAQLEYLSEQGDIESYTGSPSSAINSQTVGNYSSSGGIKKFNNYYLGGIPISPIAKIYLDEAGLTYTGF